MSRGKKQGYFGWRGTTALAVALIAGPLGLSLVLASPQGAANLDQIRNGKFSAPISPANWVNGNAGFQNAHYLEGHSIGYRAILTDLPLGVEIRLTIEQDIKHSNTHALDYLTHFQRLEPHAGFGHASEVIDPRIDVAAVSGSPLLGDDQIAIPAPSSAGSPVAGQPTQSYNDLIADFGASAVEMTIYNGFFTNPITYAAQGNLLASKSSSSIVISFEATNSTVVLAWGGHIASRDDWGFDADGVPRSAGGINGSPYHMRLIDWEDGDVQLTNLGNQDRSLKAAAVFVPPVCEGGCDLDVCEDDRAECCVSGAEGTEPYTIEWSDGTICNGLNDGQPCCIVFDPAAVGDTGTYTARVTDAIGLTNDPAEDCEFILDVAPKPAADAGDDDEDCQAATGPTCFTMNGSCTNGTPSWSLDSQSTDPPGCVIGITGGNTETPNVCFPAGCTGSATLKLTCTGDPACPPDSDTADLTVGERPNADAGAGDDKCMEETGPTCFTVNDADCFGDSPSWSDDDSGTTPPGCVTITNPNTITPTVCFAAGCTGTSTLTLTCTGDPLCPPATDTADYTVFELPACEIPLETFTICQPQDLSTSSPGKICGGTPSGGSGGYTCTASRACAGGSNADGACSTDVDCPGGVCSGAGWVIGACTITTQFEIDFTILDPSTAEQDVRLKVTVTDSNGCMGMCNGNAGIAVECEAVAGAVCEDELGDVIATVTAGLNGQTIDWFGPLAVGAAPSATFPFCPPVVCPPDADLASGVHGAPVGSCSGLNVTDPCPLPWSESSAGCYEFCALDTEPNDFDSSCGAGFPVFPNPDCQDLDVVRVCDGETHQFCTTVSGGTAPYDVEWTRDSDGNVEATCNNVAEGGQCCFSTNVAGTYSAAITDSAPVTRIGAADHCFGGCTAELTVENCACRVTGGGVDGTVPPKSFASGEDNDSNHYTFGGQAGAPTASQPQPSGEWTHRQHSGDGGRFTFHAGTASAPEDTEIALILCHDPDNCNPARPAPNKQIDFEGVGSFKNIHGPGDVKDTGCASSRDGSLHWFEVHIEDLGEPGNQDADNIGGPNCPFEGHANEPNGDEKCECPDFYHIRIHCSASPGSAVIYEVSGYINGGNLQIHPPVGE